jgi:hypothetical protein
MVAVARKSFHIKTKYIDAECFIAKCAYGNGRIALQLINVNGEPQATATVNLPDEPCPEGYTFIKDYGENEDVLQALVDAGVVGFPKTYVHSGFVDIPMCKVLI